MFFKQICLAMTAIAFASAGCSHSDTQKMKDDAQAAQIMTGMLKLGQETGVNVVPLYAVSDDPPATILDLAATMGVDILMLGTRHRRSLADLLKGDVANRVARDLPENIQLVIHG